MNPVMHMTSPTFRGTDRTEAGMDGRDVLVTTLAVWGVYTAYRIVQTVLMAHVEPPDGVRDVHRVILSIIDGIMMVAMTPLAMWATEKFPIDRYHLRHVAAHFAIGLLWSFAGVAGMREAGTVVTGIPLTIPLLEDVIRWGTFNLFAYSVAAAIAHAMVGARRENMARIRASQLEGQLSVARLEALKAQLEPHFLFNTLHAVSELVHTDPDAADATLMKLGDLLRRTLETSPSQAVTVEDELRYVGAYLDIHRVRHGARLGVQYRIEDGAESAYVPSMILQPLVENAVRHGIARIQSGGTITISAHRANGRLVLAVSDDGAGITGPIREGVGLTNTRKRLEALYGPDQSLEIVSIPPRGTQATVSLPAALVR